MSAFKSGYVAILGRPNVGKSTLLNRLLGEKISIVSEKPQTTRNRIVGIVNPPNAQVIFLDTPGIHKGRDTFNKWMVDQALSTLSEVEIAALVVDAGETPGPGDKRVAEAIVQSKKPGVLVVNKMDLVPAAQREAKIAAYRALLPGAAVFAMSALKGGGVDELLEALVERLPEGPAYFPDDQLTDVPERFVAAEIVREKVFLRTKEEIPYAVAVVCDSFHEGDPIHIECTLYVERESQKGMLIGKGGQMLKAIGTDARHELERFLAAKVMLKLWVKVRKDWSKDKASLEEFGYRGDRS